jgi:Fe2+ or Zn2+ uptake regulation protein
VVKRLGLGSFAVAYQVLELFSEDFQVIKIAVRDNHSLFERVQQEFRFCTTRLKPPIAIL